jgi:hypothetical protein
MVEMILIIVLLRHPSPPLAARYADNTAVGDLVAVAAETAEEAASAKTAMINGTARMMVGPFCRAWAPVVAPTLFGDN